MQIYDQRCETGAHPLGDLLPCEEGGLAVVDVGAKEAGEGAPPLVLLPHPKRRASQLPRRETLNDEDGERGFVPAARAAGREDSLGLVDPPPLEAPAGRGGVGPVEACVEGPPVVGRAVARALRHALGVEGRLGAERGLHARIGVREAAYADTVGAEVGAAKGEARRVAFVEFVLAVVPGVEEGGDGVAQAIGRRVANARRGQAARVRPCWGREGGGAGAGMSGPRTGLSRGVDELVGGHGPRPLFVALV